MNYMDAIGSKTQYRDRTITGILTVLLFFSGFLLRGSVLNLNFEEISGSSAIKGWYFEGRDSDITLSKKVVYSGKYSLQMKKSTVFNQAVSWSNIPIQSIRNKQITITGFIKTKAVSSGSASLWCRIEGEYTLLGKERIKSNGATGTKKWNRHALQVKVPQKAHFFTFGVILTGKGTAWLPVVGSVSITQADGVFRRNSGRILF